MRIIIDIHDYALGDMTQEEFKSNERAIMSVMMDAFSEFQNNRGPSASEYVNRRYPDNPSYSWMNREDKIKQINKRLRIASLLHNQVCNMKIEW